MATATWPKLVVESGLLQTKERVGALFGGLYRAHVAPMPAVRWCANSREAPHNLISETPHPLSMSHVRPRCRLRSAHNAFQCVPAILQDAVLIRAHKSSTRSKS